MKFWKYHTQHLSLSLIRQKYCWYEMENVLNRRYNNNNKLLMGMVIFGSDTTKKSMKKNVEK